MSAVAAPVPPSKRSIQGPTGCPRFTGLWECSTRMDGNVKACLNRPVHIPTFLDQGLCNPSYVESLPCNCNNTNTNINTNISRITKSSTDPSSSVAVMTPLMDASRAAVQQQQRLTTRQVLVPKSATEAFTVDNSQPMFYEDDEDSMVYN
jgi:hypothetical protein